MIDTHCHPYLNTKKSTEQTIMDFFDADGEAMIIVGTNIETCKKAIKLAETHKNIYVSIGIHPCDVEGLDLLETIQTLETLYKNHSEKIVAIGEIGLDYYWIHADAEKLETEQKLKNKTAYIQKRKELQALFFKAQILLAKSYNIPFIIHNRDSKDDVLAILQEMGYTNFVFHCFSENYEYAKKILSFAPESMISFSGIVTFKNALEVQEVAKNIPEQNILAETDSPYLTPTPFRGKEENEPKFTKYVIEKISDLRGKNMQEIILKNSKRFFNI